MPGDRMDGSAYAQLAEDVDRHIVQRDFLSTPHDIRDALMVVKSALCGVTKVDVIGSVEIVLAELCNNIGQHGYDNVGRISVRLAQDGNNVVCTVIDQGQAPPPGFFCPAFADPPTVPAEDLPINGFGGYLIRAFAKGLRYQRTFGWNIVTFHIAG